MSILGFPLLIVVVPELPDVGVDAGPGLACGTRPLNVDASTTVGQILYERSA